MVEEIFIFEKDYLGTTDYDKSLEGKLRECMQGKYKLILDFSKTKGVQSDFYQNMLGTILTEAEKLGKEWIEYTEERLSLVFESKESKSYRKLEDLGITPCLNIHFKNETYKNTSENQ